MTLVCLLVVGAILVSSGCAGGVRSCGRRISENLVARVVGGHAASFGEIPWQASIQESRLFGLLTYRKCGAVVIHQNWLVTAAHCTTMWVFSELHITIGEHEIVKEDKDRKDINKKGTKKKHDPDVYSKHTKSVVQRRKVKRIISHPMFSPLDLEDDIALIELDKPLEFGPNIQPICLPNKNADFTRQEGIVSGWGFTAYRSGPLPTVLQVVNLPIMSNEKCRQMYAASGVRKRVPPTVVCAGYAEGGKDSCEGDSGGPLMVWSQQQSSWILVGVVSNGIRCAEPNLPGIYVRVSQYVDWINKYVRW